ncbi:MAG: DUF1080 domain-containing protein [Planctomycetaceae bacterium]|jgi:hypothetical protein|nr:DUF1080 domain-containing protein [Planctomycetaceae bacterium]
MKKCFFLLLVLSLSVTGVSAQVTDPAEKELGFVSLFNGENLDGWQGAVNHYFAKDGILVCDKIGGNLLTAEQYANFIFRFDFKLKANGNNGVTFRASDPAGELSFNKGTEIQLLDDTGVEYAGKIAEYQFCGSIYGVAPAKQGSLNPVGEWNAMEILCDGTRVKITINGKDVVDVKVDEIKTPYPDHRDHPALRNTAGYIGFLGHNHELEFRNLRIKTLNQFGQGEKVLTREKELKAKSV